MLHGLKGLLFFSNHKNKLISDKDIFSVALTIFCISLYHPYYRLGKLNISNKPIVLFITKLELVLKIKENL